MNAKKPMPIGIENFAALVKNGYSFVDKTRFISEIRKSVGQVTLVTRPRRFGKTLTLSMLRYFFTPEDAAENRKIFEGLDVSRDEAAMAEQGCRPVIFLTLKDVQGRNFADMMTMLGAFLAKLYSSFSYLLESKYLSPRDKDYFSGLLDEQLPHAKLQLALVNLTEYLYRHHRARPILLIDEYDSPIISAWSGGFYDEAISFMRGFFSAAFKTNDSLHLALLTGIARISKESIFSGLNNLRVSSVLSTKYSDIFGFTQAEAEKLMAECGEEKNIPSLKKWYDGYRFGSDEIYNPWSVMNFIDNGCTLKPYWINTSGNVIIKALLTNIDEERQSELLGLVGGGSVDVEANENIVYGSLEENPNALYMMLLAAGYLKAVRQWKDEREKDWASLKIPNKEILLTYEDEIIGVLAPTRGQMAARKMLIAMTEGDATGFAHYLSLILRDYVSYHDAAREPETFYHGLLLGLMVFLSGKYRVESNKESGYGRFDLALFPLKESAPGVIVELKVCRREVDMQKTAEDALAQIEGKKYAAEMAKHGILCAWRFGVAFCGKKAAIAYGQR